MNYIEAPNHWNNIEQKQRSVFLAGGITGCPDWQKELVELLKDTRYTILNPRQENFPIHDVNAAKLQIQWEWEYLRNVNVISFWFPREGVQPIVLYELGAWSMATKAMVVGVEPGFWREQDVYIQTELTRPDITIVDNLEAVADQLIQLEQPSIPQQKL